MKSNGLPNPIRQIYPEISGVDEKCVLRKIEDRLGQRSSDIQETQSFYPQVSNIQSPSNSPLPQLMYPQLPEVQYYQQFYNCSPDSEWMNTSLHFNPWTAQSWLHNSPKKTATLPAGGNVQLYPVISMPPPTPVFSLEEFQKLRHHASVDDALGQLNEIATCLNNKTKDSLPHNIVRACFICANSYTKEKFKLGVGPINDSITVAANHKYMGYKVYYVHNPKSTQFLTFLQAFLERTTEYLTIFFTGHGTNQKNRNGTEKSGFDQYMVFDDDYVKDDTLAQYLQDYATGAPKTLLLSDCCHSGTIWDIPEDPIEATKFPANIVSISSSDDVNTAKQGTIDNNSQGIFTFFFWRTIKEHPDYSFSQIKPIVDKAVKKYSQECIIHATRNNVVNSVFFPPHLK